MKTTAESTHSESAGSNSPAAIEGWSRGIEAIAREIGHTLR
jgi:hypothetical protein